VEARIRRISALTRLAGGFDQLFVLHAFSA
jgi:hypothetical protein